VGGKWQQVTRAADVTMAQAGSAQREPSMEEILASIRRIIEDSDTGRKAEVEQGRPEFETASSSASDYAPARHDNEAPSGAVIDVDAFRAELRAPAPEPRKPVTLAEVQAQIAADARKRAGGNIPSAELEAAPVAEAAPAVESVGESPQAAETPAQPDWRDTFSAQAAPETPTPGAAPMPSSVSDVDAAGRAPREDIVAVQQPDNNSIREPASAAEVAPAHDAGDSIAPGAAENGVARPAIISEQASRQVAAAFSELSEAFAARSKKTFDEMAEQMMRPMLQDWLDNNLPTLVEKLVREEIERVARGAQ
jgi:cell pole-organizing protein PopZ